jgi:hypothetical protein
MVARHVEPAMTREGVDAAGLAVVINEIEEV